jgi:hypothetical protein
VPPRGHFFAGRSHPDAHAAEPVQGQSFAGLAVGAGVFIDRALVLEGKQGLDLADDFAAGGIGLEHLAEEAKEGAAHAIDALTAVAALVGLGKQARRQERLEQQLQVAKTLLAQVLDPATQGRQAGTEGRKEGRVHRAVYIPTLLTSRLPWVFMNVNLAQIKDEYAQLRARLGRLGWLSHGYVQDRGPGAGGPCYQWTRKVKTKTVSVALSREQYEALKQAIDNWHQAQEILHRMQTLSRLVIFETLPSPPRRKRLGKRVLGLI